MGSGKSSVGRVLAREMGKSFIDIDQRIEKKAGKSIARIFAEEGEPAFRVLEKNAIRTASTSGNKVIACGGGVVLDAQNISDLKRQAVVIYLKSSLAVIRQRVAAKRSSRPLLTGEKWIDTMNTLLAKRERLYAQAADIIVENNNTDIAATVKIIMQELREYEGFNF
jgi:shikimate kinase